MARFTSPVGATIGDIGIETPFTVFGGTINFSGQTAVQPTFDGDPLFSGYYVKTSGNLVHFQIQVDFDNITNFGNGQYYVQLPFNAKHAAMMRDGCLHRASNGRQYSTNGHVYAGSNQLTLWYTSGTGQDEEFDHNSPYGLQVEDNFHIAGTYICQ